MRPQSHVNCTAIDKIWRRRDDGARAASFTYTRDSPAAEVVSDDAWLRATSLYAQYALAKSLTTIRKEMPVRLTLERRLAIDRAVRSANPGAARAASSKRAGGAPWSQ